MKKRFERLRCVLAAAVLLVLAAPASNAAESAPPPREELAKAQALLDSGQFGEVLDTLRPLARRHPENTNVLFLLGLAAMEAARRLPPGAEEEREALLDESIAALHTILIDRPELVRVRLELARAFFYKGEDSLSRRHFERVLAGEVPAEVAINVQRFLSQIRARRRWVGYLGASLAPDTNIGAASDEEIIYILGLPFRRDNADELTTSGVGVSIWTGGEYQHPVGNRLRLRAGVDVARREYASRQFDETNLAVHLGPGWLADPRTDLSLLAEARRSWASTSVNHDAAGARIEARRRLTPLITADARASWLQRDYRLRDDLDGHVADISLRGTQTLTPTVQIESAFGASRERPESVRQRNRSRRLRAGVSLILPWGISARATAQRRWTEYEGDWGFFTQSTAPRKDRTSTLSLSLHKRDLTLYGFSPQVVVTHEERDSNAQIHDYNRTRGEIRFVRQF